MPKLCIETGILFSSRTYGSDTAVPDFLGTVVSDPYVPLTEYHFLMLIKSK